MLYLISAINLLKNVLVKLWSFKLIKVLVIGWFAIYLVWGFGSSVLSRLSSQGMLELPSFLNLSVMTSDNTQDDDINSGEIMLISTNNVSTNGAILISASNVNMAQFVSELAFISYNPNYTKSGKTTAGVLGALITLASVFGPGIVLIIIVLFVQKALSDMKAPPLPIIYSKDDADEVIVEDYRMPMLYTKGESEEYEDDEEDEDDNEDDETTQLKADGE